MARQSIDLRAEAGTGEPAGGTLLLDEPPAPPLAPPTSAPASGLAPALAPAPVRALIVWLWRTLMAVAVLLAVVGAAAWASTPPA